MPGAKMLKKLKIRRSAKPAATPTPTTEKEKPRKKRRNADREITYRVRIYSTGIVRWTDKQKTRVIKCEGGLLYFEHRKPYSKLMVQPVVPLERVIQYGGTDEGGWVHLKATRTVIDDFIAIAIKREGSYIEFDLGDGITTQVNADADFEVLGTSD